MVIEPAPHGGIDVKATRHCLPGAATGAWSDASDRRPRLVLRGIEDQVTGERGARTGYGAVIEEADRSIDASTTRRLRVDLRERPSALLDHVV